MERSIDDIVEEYRKMLGMDPADRAVAERVADLPLVEPAPGYEDRAVERARRDGVL